MTDMNNKHEEMDSVTEQNSQQGSAESPNLIFKNPFDLDEEVYVRTVAKGRYTPTVHEFDDIVINTELKQNEKRLLFFIKKQTVNFWNTHTRLRRKDIEQALGLARPHLLTAIKGLVDAGYLLEKPDTDNYYFYGINPAKFPGLFVLKSKNHCYEKLNRQEKKKLGLVTKKVTGGYEKGNELLRKMYSETISSTQNYSALETLKYILLKYILLKGISQGNALKVIGLFDQVKNPEWVLQQLATLLHKQPSSARGIIEELLRAERTGIDAYGKPIRTHSLIYLINQWPNVKHFWENLDHRMDMSPEAVALRNEAYEVIMGYEVQDNIIEFKQKSNTQR